MSLDAIGIVCKDIYKTIEFYRILDIEFKEYGGSHYEATTKSGFRIMLDSFELMKKINPNWIEPKNPGITLCFLKESPSDVDITYQKIIDAGFISVKQPWDAFWGQRYSSVKDPNGNQIDIFASLDKE